MEDSWQEISPLRNALDLWMAIASESKFTEKDLKNPEGALFCLKKISEILGLHKMVIFCSPLRQ